MFFLFYMFVSRLVDLGALDLHCDLGPKKKKNKTKIKIDVMSRSRFFNIQ